MFFFLPSVVVFWPKKFPSQLYCRFPHGVPWVRYVGSYKDLKINLVWPGKDTLFGKILLHSYLTYYARLVGSPLRSKSISLLDIMNKLWRRLSYGDQSFQKNSSRGNIFSLRSHSQSWIWWKTRGCSSDISEGTESMDLRCNFFWLGDARNKFFVCILDPYRKPWREVPYSPTILSPGVFPCISTSKRKRNYPVLCPTSINRHHCHFLTLPHPRTRNHFEPPRPKPERERRREP